MTGAVGNLHVDAVRTASRGEGGGSVHLDVVGALPEGMVASAMGAGDGAALVSGMQIERQTAAPAVEDRVDNRQVVCFAAWHPGGSSDSLLITQVEIDEKSAHRAEARKFSLDVGGGGLLAENGLKLLSGHFVGDV